LEVGAVSQVIKSEAGYHILKVLEIQADRPLSPDMVLALQNRALENWLANRRQQSTIGLNVN
jgi:parvulin-like peptidyl-prolyl isomerase